MQDIQAIQAHIVTTQHAFSVKLGQVLLYSHIICRALRDGVNGVTLFTKVTTESADKIPDHI